MSGSETEHGQACLLLLEGLARSGLLESDALSDPTRIHPPEVQASHVRASSDVSNLNPQQSDGEFGIESLMAAGTIVARC